MSDWREDALCQEVDPEIFFPDKGRTVTDAKRVCMACEVRTECLQDALATNERFGVRGGKTERERRKLKKAAEQEVAA
jgi:WhiB family transcriptional regulator, redox-sensing transcriptional regulator